MSPHLRWSLVPLLVATSAHAGWKLDATKTELVVKVWKTGAAAGLAHDHVVRASRFEGTASLDEAGSASSLSVTLTATTADLVPDEPEARKRYGVEGPLVPDGDRKKILENLLGPEQLEATRFPTVKFVSTRVSVNDKGALSCTGTFTLHGVSKEITFTFTASRKGEVFEADAHVRFKTSDYGVQPYSAALGLIKNRDEVELVLHVTLSHVAE